MYDKHEQTNMSEIIREFLVGLSNLEEEVNRFLTSQSDLDVLERYSSRVEQAISRVRWINSIISDSGQAANDAITQFNDQLQQLKGSLEALLLRILEKRRFLDSLPYRCAREEGNIGCPRYIITREQITYLREFSFKWVDIAELLGVSISTLNRHRTSLGLGDATQRFTVMDDRQLDDVVRDVVQRQPFSGIRLVQGELESIGIHVQRERIWASLHRVDSLNVRARLSHVVQRRQYRVPSPNSLWHVDGNHKLIRWKLVIHGGIDGFSRLCVFLACATNNRASTVADKFISATAEFGWPSRVRSDKGMENIEVARLMVTHRGTGRGSHITGSSVHNQRIERLWRDYFRCVGALYYNLFYFLEDRALLDPNNDTDMFCLHYVYTPIINRSLQVFKRSWNNHRLGSAGNFTPHQLFIRGMLERFGSSDVAVRDVFDTDQIDETHYGIDGDGPTPEMRSNNDVQITQITCPLTEAQLARLDEIISSLQPCPNHGITLYLAAKEYTINNMI